MRNPKLETQAPCLLAGPHWEVAPVRDLPVFFRSLPLLAPPGSVLCLADGAWDEELRRFLDEQRVPPPAGLVRPREFRHGVDLPATPVVLGELAALADHHAAPEIASCLAVSSGSTRMLEWHDLPDAPLALARGTPVENILAFCRRVGVTFAIL